MSNHPYSRFIFVVNYIILGGKWKDERKNISKRFGIILTSFSIYE
ncbi:hypothetical protein C2W64_00762 [Brevibacillus laterosporus]|nr:hypothetical protein C2W64_00762 [Brevibacillus laterosporus]